MGFSLHSVSRNSAFIWNRSVTDRALGPITLTSMSVGLLAYKDWSIIFLRSLHPSLESCFVTKILKNVYALPHLESPAAPTSCTNVVQQYT